MFKDAIQAIADTAFTTSDYPVILSFENHCSPKQQLKMVQYCRDILGDLLLQSPLEDYPIEAGVCLPSPKALKRRILIKNKVEKTSGIAGVTETASASSVTNASSTFDSEGSTGSDSSETEPMVTALSELVIYTRAMGKFTSFAECDTRKVHSEMYSMVETKAIGLLNRYSANFIDHNRRQLTRVYPKGSRVDSSNYMPLIFWNCGCQMVAINLQTPDVCTQINSAFFELNGGCGYVLKPACMRQADGNFDPLGTDEVEGVVPNTLTVTIVSAQFLWLLCDAKPVTVYVEVDLYGLSADSHKKMMRTGVPFREPHLRTPPVEFDGYNTTFEAGSNDFKYSREKIVLPAMAFLRLAVFEERGRLLGQCILPVLHLQPGYKHLVLKNQWNKPLGLATLFVHIDVQDMDPPNPTSRAALDIPESYKMYNGDEGEELFVLHDSGKEDANRFIVIGRQSVSEHAQSITKIYTRGSFKVAPSLFYQLLVVLGRRDGYIDPIFYALLPDKRQESYIRLFATLKHLYPSLKPSRISMDFENALINAGRECFPDSNLEGSLFDLLQKVERQLQINGLMVKYDKDPEFARAARKIVALAYVPSARVNSAFKRLRQTAPHDLRPVLDWFETYFIGHERRGIHREPAFPVALWSVHDRVQEEGNERATLARGEELHHRMHDTFDGSEPNFFRFVNNLRSFQAAADQERDEFLRQKGSIRDAMVSATHFPLFQHEELTD
ncbi:hypothetical protein AAVH_22058 [Aphelenchoides avenae]|nr:hypothetical protein AAVH_22058 [Aphelenchus avenae]